MFVFSPLGYDNLLLPSMVLGLGGVIAIGLIPFERLLLLLCKD